MKKQLALLGVATMIALSGCGKNTTNEIPTNNSQNGNSTETNHSDMNHSTTGEVPKGLKEANNPTYKVGSQAVINADHMEGMNGATATIVGAYTTTVYSVSYTPTSGGEKVTNHKWVIHEEIKDASGKAYEPGEEVVLQADHMKGMNGATATIDSAEQTTVYMADYTPSTGGEKVKNHQWVTENELSSNGTAGEGNMSGMNH
ncbi:YdhK family protein [Paenibacillus sp. LHD-38]|uniref:YdhK family protein n=1 Tax=Paenibacillus sp. LHD-38 TaxID=3072143 RepID=UPI0028109582|nr:YdhK family protein [Paenibacillus sp. LHD-38]MDQ8734859.1 YdhK family protein [Paenibacillus sp. LHD-38]